MTRSADLNAVNCGGCGAGLDVLGGGRVVVHICPYCGSELDPVNEYRTLRQITKMQRPESPFSIGMKGELFGVEHTVIGTLAMKEEWDGLVWRWVEHQLYSPTHGYAWLSVEDGHIIYARRYRGSEWLTSKQVERAESRPLVHARGRRYKYYETSTSEITFAEGEFTWAPQWGEQTTTVSVMSDDEMLDFSQTGSERETYRSVYVHRNVAEEAFGVDLPVPERGHPLQPFDRGENFGFLRNAGAGFALLCLLLAGIFSLLPGHFVLAPTSIAVANMPAELAFNITQTNKLVRVRIEGNGMNNWVYVEMEMTGPDDTVLFEAARTVERYAGHWSEGRWNEGSNSGTFRFIPDVPGTYTLAMNVIENEIWEDQIDFGRTPRNKASALTISVKAGLSSGMWLLFLAVGFGAVSLFQYGRQMLHHNVRWGRSDWTDED